jgi:hypothetical protein
VTANLVSGDRDSANAMTTDDENDNHTKQHPLAVAAASNSSHQQFTTLAPILRNLAEDDDGTTPIYWSASQLLAHRESMGHSPDPNYPFPSQLDPIREEFNDEVDDDVYAQVITYSVTLLTKKNFYHKTKYLFKSTVFLG